ncbi:MAG: phosphate ABC transporter permease subunit PstC [Flavobacteriaceae bacterium]
MSTGLLLLLLAAAFLVAVLVGRGRAGSLWRAGARLHSRPAYHGVFLAMVTVLPALAVVVVWAIAEPVAISSVARAELPPEVRALPASEQSLVLGVVSNLANGYDRLGADDIAAVRAGGDGVQRLLAERGIFVPAAPEAYVVDLAERMAGLKRTSRLAAAAVTILAALAGFLLGWRRIAPGMRARNLVERMMMAGLMAASAVAILTTVGIVLSVLFESIHFFSLVPITDFLFGTVWDPRFSAPGRDGAGQFGILPLLWGTLYISFVALLVAVPVGLFSAIYMAEYADSRVRAFAKPVLEILAGIPTIVYGLFALITFGPVLRDTGAAVGIDISANSVLTAGIVMGVMIIPFVSSLSDDIITAVPRALREGSYGLGATQSETIKKVVMPAALPGIVGAVLLAASRAIGETMIVVLAAGIAANLTANPLEPVTTITVKIVSQLTGDLEFNSPQTLVAFALGLTLFIITLGLNIVALRTVRKYREQYE